MGRTEDLSDFQHGTAIGCYLSNKSVHQISALLVLPQSTVSAVLVKWKCLGETTAQLRSGKPHKLTERDHQVLKRVTWKNRLDATLTTEFQIDSGSNISTNNVRRSFMKWASMAKQPHASLRSPCAMPSVDWSGVKLTAIGLWSDESCFT